MTTTIKTIAAGWKKSGCGLASEIVVRNLAPEGAERRDGRWCVFMTCAEIEWIEISPHNGYYSQSAALYLGEYGTIAEANRAAGQYRRTMNAAYNAALTTG